MVEQDQAKLEEAQVTAIGAMNDLDPIIPLGNDIQVDDPSIGQAGRDHQPSQPIWSCQVAFVQVEAAAFLVGKEGLDAKAFGIPVASFIRQFQVGHQIDRLLVILIPTRRWPRRGRIPGE
jgi:hypothetical protein